MEIYNKELEIQGNNGLGERNKKINIKAQLGKIYAIDTFWGIYDCRCFLGCAAGSSWLLNTGDRLV